MFTFLTALLCLILGYAFYGKFIAKLFGIDPKRETPVQRLADGVDYIEIKPWRTFMIQLLNIAGLGPIFGAVLGAAYGPVAYIWIVLGCIFMGAAHDFFSGAISMRMDGCSQPDIVGNLLGKGMQRFLVLFSGIMLLAVGIAFVNGPAGLLASQSASLLKDVPAGSFISASGISVSGIFSLEWIPIWTSLIIVYYVLAVLLPINKIIGSIYPIFSIALIFMAVGVAGSMLWLDFTGTLSMPELTLSSLKNFHTDPDLNPLFPTLFIVISCGAISGFHATQSPMMARCLKSEKYARPVFYGAMIAEGVIALIWASAAIAYCGGAEGLNASEKTPAVLVNEICTAWLGTAGAVAAILGVIVCPITSGDTALRSVRLIAADALKISQKPMRNRIWISLPIFAVALFLSQIRFEVIWRYVGLANQILAAITLWASAVWLVRERKPHWYLSIPAAFLTSVCITYFLNAPHNLGGLALPYTPSWIAGTLSAAALLGIFVKKSRK
ncbi:MAG: carbon starvation protein A [Opitutales bacterium]|nr:carbon starvation protein A [Opitutales bacterium]